MDRNTPRPLRRGRGNFRQPAGRLWRRLYAELGEVLGADRSLLVEDGLKRLCSLLVLSESLTERVTAGEPVDAMALLRVNDGIARLTRQLGLGATNEPAPPDFSSMSRQEFLAHTRRTYGGEP